MKVLYILSLIILMQNSSIIAQHGDYTFFKVSPKENYVAIGYRDGYVKVKFTNKDSTLFEGMSFNNKIEIISFSSNEKSIIIRDKSGFIKLFSINNLEKPLFNEKTDKELRYLEYFNNDKNIFILFEDGSIKILNTISNKIDQEYSVPFNISEASLRQSDDRWYMSFGLENGEVKILSLKTSKITKTILVDKTNINSCLFHPDGNLIISTTEEAIFFHNLQNGKQVKKITTKDGAEWALFYSKDKKQFVTLNKDDKLCFRTIGNNNILKMMPIPQDFDYNAKTNALYYEENNEIIFRNAETGGIVKKLKF